MSDETKKLTPEEVLINVLADAGRIERILIMVDCKGTFEYWSNGLDLVERSGMLKVATERCNKYIKEMEDIDH